MIPRSNWAKDRKMFSVKQPMEVNCWNTNLYPHFPAKHYLIPSKA